jgi:dihydropteroate synthase
MGIVNITPDSFYAGSRQTDSVLDRVERMWQEGASFIDIGGYSSRPGADDIPLEEELNRVIPVVKTLQHSFPDILLSIDTFRSEVARQAILEGAVMVNDISGGNLDEKMLAVVGQAQVPYVMMHMRGTPQTMNQLTEYESLAKDIVNYFHGGIYKAQLAGIKDIILDPGFGFAKTVQQNFELLNQFDHLRILGKPILVGLSRKSMIWRTLKTNPEEALNGTTALHTIALMKGASILRVHDVKEAVECIKLIHETNSAQ